MESKNDILKLFTLSPKVCKGLTEEMDYRGNPDLTEFPDEMAWTEFLDWMEFLEHLVKYNGSSFFVSYSKTTNPV